MKTYCTPGAPVADLPRDIIANAAALRQGVGRALGERPAPCLLLAPVDLFKIFDRPCRRTVEEAVGLGLRVSARC